MPSPEQITALLFIAMLVVGPCIVFTIGYTIMQQRIDKQNATRRNPND